MTFASRILLRWLPFAGLATAMCLLVYLAVQQVWRQSANDPQVQIARDTGRMLAVGVPPASAIPAGQIDIGGSLASFVTVYNDEGAPLASSGKLHGLAPVVPPGVLDHVRRHGEERVTLQPEPNVRIAAVVRQPDNGAGFVLAGRSLRENEERTARFGSLVAVAWVAMLVGLFVLVAVSEYLLTERPVKQISSA